MFLRQTLSRNLPRINNASIRTISSRGHSHRAATRVASPYAARRQQHFIRSLITVTALGAFAIGVQWYLGDRLIRSVHAEVPPPEPEIQFEKSFKKGPDKEDNRDLISSQHLQVKRSWEAPGVYAWGSNAGRVVAPDSEDLFVKRPRRIPFFNGVLLRDLKLDRNFGAAIDEQGNLLQWGTAFSTESTSPTLTLQGKSLKSLAISRDRILALGGGGKVYSVPVSQKEQQSGKKPQETSWIPFYSSQSPISYRIIQPTNLSWKERTIRIDSGLEHLLLLTNRGRVYSAASGTEDFPSKGQLGIPGLAWTTRPKGRYDQCHEITTLHGFDIKHIAAGDYHSLVADKDGRIFAFGDNSFGQLGLDRSSDIPMKDTPSLLPIQKLYSTTNHALEVTGIAAGGSTSYLTIDTTEVAGQTEKPSVRHSLGRVTADVWSWGQGIWGSLGNGRWTHVQPTPTKIPALSGLFEYSEEKSAIVPIRLRSLSVGQGHAATVLGNAAYVDSSAYTSDSDTNWGADVLFFGSNEFYQLGTGKRNNLSQPTYIQPLDQVAEKKIRRGEEHRFQITPRKTVEVGGRRVALEQRVECGRGCTAVYSGV